MAARICDEFICPICTGVLKKTMTAKECLHRFCAKCIEQALRSGNKECPVCREKLISRRSLRADAMFDSVIAQIYGDRDECEERRENSVIQFNQQSADSRAALSNSISKAITEQRSKKGNRCSRDGQFNRIENSCGPFHISSLI